MLDIEPQIEKIIFHFYKKKKKKYNKWNGPNYFSSI